MIGQKEYQSDMHNIQMEICCGTASDASIAVQHGADRIELNSALELGGLTPSVGCMAATRSLVSVPVLVMIRPRAGDFCYDEFDWRTAVVDAKALIHNGADGLVFGFLTPNHQIDVDRAKAMLDLAKGRDCVFHRAFDYTPDWKKAIDTLINLGIRRVLTSGQRSCAAEGADRLAEMVSYAGDAIEILPGGGIRPDNVQSILQATGCRQVHLSAGKQQTIHYSDHSSDIRLGEKDNGESHFSLDPQIVTEMRLILDSMEV